jgi:rhodanese-related sulfurtransferase
VSLFASRPPQSRTGAAQQATAGPAPEPDARPQGAREAGDELVPVDTGLLTAVPASKLRSASPLAYDFCQRFVAKWRYIAFGQHPPPIPSYRGPVEAPEHGRTGICCSGGGIRSAAFNLGALQALDEQDELASARYLAAVSGGSYICAAYSMVGKVWSGNKRPPDDEDKPYNGYDDSNPRLFTKEDRTRIFARLSPEEQYLRNRSSYMAPTVMEKIFLGIRILLGLVANLVFIGLPIAVVTTVLGILVYAPSRPDVLPSCPGSQCSFDPSAAWWLPAAALAAAGIIVAAARVMRRPHSDDERAATEIWSTRLILFAGIVALFTLALPAAVGFLEHPHVVNAGATPKAAGVGAVGFAGVITGLLAFGREAFASPAKAAKDLGAARTWLMKLSAPVRRALILVAGAVAGPLLLFAIAVLMLSVTLDQYDSHRTALWVGAAAGALAFAGFYYLADLTSWSLHPFYKRRLCTAFALKRVSPGEISHARAVADIEQETTYGVAVEREFDRNVPLSKTALQDWPSLIVCAAANISDPGATAPGRQVTSFTFSADSVGGPLVGAMETEEYEQAFGDNRKGNRRRRDCSLPAAVAMSGAAISPSMGKMSRPAFRFLLALANIRLGVWVPNPRWVVDASERQRRRYGAPRPAHLLRELIGRNRVDAKYLYVTDGGHYENLGLVELLRRGCTRVFCFDASGGQRFAELGDAVALARSELGVKIEIDPTPLSPKGDPPTAKRATTTGWIHYPNGVKGHLVYSRNVMSPGGPWDVRAHQLENPSFPHDSTVDQLYTDQKFESYRALGAEAGKRAVARMNEVAPKSSGPPPSGPDGALPPQRVREMLLTSTVQLVDLRADFAYELAHIEGALRVSLAEVDSKQDGFVAGHPIVFHCYEGAHSRGAAARYREKGWTAFYIEGGIRRWIDDGLPIEGKTKSLNGGPPADAAKDAEPAKPAG